ncbi:sensor histidine kinase [Galbitalea soli]|uniref:histidine kinase n=1 Tax=Galbitalea soli TaxID=1268042 RepID=A0A7C9PP78_9MICO|nr:HAMP domain-containing sensor histidine kinase [Galbitalea soli]NEM92110.1 HAMP domain-containing histidine kinase [Galbitalea soli]NYJ31938.1 two-component system OmpR family sensor kinase [Galbitalea soli]
MTRWRALASWAPTRWRARAPWTLRRRLVVSVVGLFTLLSIVVGGASVLSLYGNLESQLSGQLNRITNIAQRPSDGGGGDSGPANLFNAPGLQSGSIIAFSQGAVSAGAIRPEFGGTLKLLTSAQSAAIVAHVTSTSPTTVSVDGVGQFLFIRVDVSGVYSNVDYEYFGLPLAAAQGTVARFGAAVAGISLAGILIVAFATWGIVSYALRPLRRVAATATEVAAMELDRGEVDLSVRVPEADTDTRTEVGQVGAALNSMLGHVDEALRARQNSESKVRQFVADASHELRTPLASIRGYAELTRRGDYELPADVTHSLGRVESEAVRMTSLVEDLLLLARLDAGRDIQLAPVDLTTLLVDCVSDAHVAGDDHDWELDAPEEPVRVLADSQRIHQIIANLLANARVHTPAGTHVRIGLATVGESAVITVEDDGPGIPAEFQGELFERFARGDSSRARVTGSTGLGLAIVKAVVDAHEGEVTLESAPGRTVFRVELPGVLAAD